MSIRALAVAALGTACLALPPAAGAATPTLANWDSAQQRQVRSAGLMGNFGRWFAGASPLSAKQANAAMAALQVRLVAGGSPFVRAVRTSHSPVTVTTFDAMVVNQLGLRALASQVQSAAAAAGLQPPSYFGTETVARFLGLR
ncbi:MAG TPA: hypothetical protein VIX82_14190, partial [Solirubrobacteraceae bacterium]